MKKLIAILLLSCAACKLTPEEQAAQRHEQADLNAKMSNSIGAEMIFFRHPRADLCFAYYWGGGVHGGPTLTTVPCDKVERLLVAPPERYDDKTVHGGSSDTHQ